MKLATPVQERKNEVQWLTQVESIVTKSKIGACCATKVISRDDVTILERNMVA